MSNTPAFWLKLLPEHIDQNTDAFLTYLSGAVQNGNADPSAYAESAALLEQRCAALAAEIRGVTPGSVDKDKLGLALRLVGAKTLIERAESPETARSWFCLFIEILANLVPQKAEALAGVLVDAISSRTIDGYGFGWKNVTSADHPEIIAEVVLNGASFSNEKLPERWYQGAGTVRISGGSVELWRFNRNLVRAAATPKVSFSAAGGRVKVMDPAIERMKNGEKASADLVAKYIDAFVKDGAGMRPSPNAALKHYLPGDTMAVRFIAQDRNGNLVVETVDNGYTKLKGVIRGDMLEASTYRTADLLTFLYRGDVFLATWQGSLQNRFDVITTIPQHIQKTAISLGTVKAICKGPRGPRKLMWFTSKGYPVCTAKVDGYIFGDFALLDIVSWDEDGHVRCNVVDRLEGSVFSEDGAREAFIRSFVIPNDKIPNSLKVEDNLRDGGQLSSLARVLYLAERTIDAPSDRLNTLVTASLTAGVTGDTPTLQCARSAERHLQNLVRFVRGKQDDIETDSLEPYLVDINGAGDPRASEYIIVDTMLRSYGDLSSFDVSEGLPVGYEDGIPGRLAALYRAERQVHGLLPEDTLQILRRNVCETVRISLPDTDGLDDIEYIGPESGTQVQKVSFLVAPKNAMEQNQEKTIARVIDAFLNCETGGTLYIGVSDEGYVRGLDDDIRLAERLYPDKKGMDGYLRLIRMGLQRWFSQEVLATLSIEPVFNGRAVAIRVKPYPFGVVAMDGTAWIRFGPECIRMGQSLKERIDNQRKNKPIENK